MATKRTSILSEFETRMTAIDGTGGFVTNLTQVTRIAENPDGEVLDFTAYPTMFYKVSNVLIEYEVNSRWKENFDVNAFIIFDAELAPSLIDDLVSDVKIALVTSSNDVTMGGLADWFLIKDVLDADWLTEENITIVQIDFTCQYRNSALDR
jgi:hypothetical protein